MEALSNIQETERILQLLEDETSLLKENLSDKESDLSEFAETVEARNKEALVLIQGLEEQVESLTQENIQLRELKNASDQENSLLKNKLKQQEGVIKGQLKHAFERKVDEMGKEIRKNLEANIRIMKQRIRVAEQLQTENKENFRRMKEKCEIEHSSLGHKVQAYSRMVAKSKREFNKMFNAANETLSGLESCFDGFGEREGDFGRRISRVADEISVVKDWIKERKMNEIMKRVKELEKSSMEKEETIFELVEEKKEVIRQLSMSVEYHRNRCYQLIKLISTRTKNE